MYVGEEDDEEKEDVNSAKKEDPDLVEGQQIKDADRTSKSPEKEKEEDAASQKSGKSQDRKDRDRSRSRGKDRSRSRGKDRSRSRGKDRERRREDRKTLAISNLSRNAASPALAKLLAWLLLPSLCFLMQVNEDHLKEIFGNYGKVKEATLAIDKAAGLPKGYAYVEFYEADRAISHMNSGQSSTRLTESEGSQQLLQGMERRKSVRNESNAARNASSMSVNEIAIGTEIATASADLRQQRGDRDRDRDREKEKERAKEKEREKEKEKEKERERERAKARARRDESDSEDSEEDSIPKAKAKKPAPKKEDKEDKKDEKKEEKKETKAPAKTKAKDAEDKKKPAVKKKKEADAEEKPKVKSKTAEKPKTKDKDEKAKAKPKAKEKEEKTKVAEKPKATKTKAKEPEKSEKAEKEKVKKTDKAKAQAGEAAKKAVKALTATISKDKKPTKDAKFDRDSDQKAMELQARPKRRWKSQAAQDEISAPMDLGGYASHDPQGEVPDSVKESLQSTSTKSVCVIGGGPSGLGCCRRLCDAGLQVTLVQESRGLGGKLCTKFVNGKDDPTLHFDMGVQLLRPAGPLADDLEGVVQPWPQPGRFKRILCKGDWTRWNITSSSDVSVDGLVVGVPSMSAIGRALADKCCNLEIHVDRTAHVIGRSPKTGRWGVEWSRAEANAGQLRYRPELAQGATEAVSRSFDAVVLAFEANKILQGCKSGYKQVAPSVTPTLRKQLSGRTKTSQLWNLMVAFDRELPMPWDAATVEGHGSLAWVAVNSSKPERARVPQCFMIFSTNSWAAWKQWSKKEVERVLLHDFLSFLEQVLGFWPPEPSFVLSGRWGNNTEAVLGGARPSGEFPVRALGYSGTGESGGLPPPLWDGDVGMGATGDWARGFSVSDAYSAGQDLAETMLKAGTDRLFGG
ncbi:SR45 [Symbiodinium microadriaticum]|nr:SR45 [Symbiodinium microadriaticum]